MTSLLLVGDVNLMNVDDPAVPFARLADDFAAADALFGNLECLLYDPPDGHSVEQEGFFADPAIAGEALRLAGFAAVGLANNVNYGAAAILGSIDRLDRLGISHCGAGADLAAAAPRRSSRAAGCASAFCSAARCIGRPITKPAGRAPALPHCAPTPPTRCRRTRRGRKFRR